MSQILPFNQPGKPTPPRNRFLRMHDLENLLGCKKSTIYAMINTGNFIKPLQFTKRMVVWDELSVLAWIDSKVKSKEAA